MAWEIKKLGDVCTLRSGTTLSPKLEKPKGDLPYLKAADMNIESNIKNIKLLQGLLTIQTLMQIA